MKTNPLSAMIHFANGSLQLLTGYKHFSLRPRHVPCVKVFCVE